MNYSDNQMNEMTIRIVSEFLDETKKSCVHLEALDRMFCDLLLNINKLHPVDDIEICFPRSESIDNHIMTWDDPTW